LTRNRLPWVAEKVAYDPLTLSTLKFNLSERRGGS
jgi:hypothetical protein